MPEQQRHVGVVALHVHRPIGGERRHPLGAVAAPVQPGGEHGRAERLRRGRVVAIRGTSALTAATVGPSLARLSSVGSRDSCAATTAADVGGVAGTGGGVVTVSPRTRRAARR
jgi:hypothetical protein